MSKLAADSKQLWTYGPDEAEADNPDAEDTKNDGGAGVEADAKEEDDRHETHAMAENSPMRVEDDGLEEGPTVFAESGHPRPDGGMETEEVVPEGEKHRKLGRPCAKPRETSTSCPRAHEDLPRRRA